MKIKGYHEDKAESQAALECIAKQSFRGVSTCGKDTGECV